jgi:hypothetical protein
MPHQINPRLPHNRPYRLYQIFILAPNIKVPILVKISVLKVNAEENRKQEDHREDPSRVLDKFDGIDDQGGNYKGRVAVVGWGKFSAGVGY